MTDVESALHEYQRRVGFFRVDHFYAGYEAGHAAGAADREQAKAAGAAEERAKSGGVARIGRERERQQALGWTREHDDAEHGDGALCQAAAWYALPPFMRQYLAWPWAEQPKSGNRLRDLEKAGALIAAEIDRLEADAASATDATHGGPNNSTSN